MQQTEPAALSRNARWLRVAALVVGLAYTAGVFAFVVRTAYFYGDDWFAFWLVRTRRLTSTVWVPVGTQVVPLHRLMSYALYQLRTIDYPAAVSLLLAFHLAGVVYLYRGLEQLGRSAWNPVMVCVYASFVDLWILFAWWSPGLQRLPFGAFALAAVFYYQRYVKTRRVRHLAAVATCTFVALGFYGKALFIPAYCAALDAARARTGPDDPRFDFRDWKRWVVLAATTAIAVAYVPGARALVGEPSGFGNTSLAFQASIAWKALVVLGHALLGVVLRFPEYGPSVVVGSFWVALFGYTVYRARSTLVAWAFAAAFLVLNVAMIGLSVRSDMFPDSIPFEPRYFFDLLVVAVPFLGVVLQQIPTDTPEARWLTTAGRGFLLPVLASAALAALAGVSYRSVTRTAYLTSASMPQTRQYMSNVREDLEKLHVDLTREAFLDDFLPTYVSGLDMVFRTQSQLFLVWNLRAHFVESPKHARYWIDGNGHINRVQQQRRPSRRY